MRVLPIPGPRLCRIAQFVNRGEAGVEIELTRRGTPVAAVVSLRALERLKGAGPRFGDAYKDFLMEISELKTGPGRTGSTI